MFLSEWRVFPSAPCLTGAEKTWWQLASPCCWNRARPWHASELVSLLVELRTYQHPSTNYIIRSSNTNVVLACTHRRQLYFRSSGMQHGSELGRKWDRQTKEMRRENGSRIRNRERKVGKKGIIHTDNNRPCSSFISGVDVWDVLCWEHATTSPVKFV